MAVDASKFKIDPHKASKEEIRAALELLEKQRVRKARIDAGEIKGGGSSWQDMTDEQKDQRRAYSRRRNVKTMLFIKAAEKAGVHWPSEAEVDAEIKRQTKAAVSA